MLPSESADKFVVQGAGDQGADAPNQRISGNLGEERVVLCRVGNVQTHGDCFRIITSLHLLENCVEDGQLAFVMLIERGGL